MSRDGIESSEKRFRASCLCEKIQKHVADLTAKRKQVDRYSRKPFHCPGRDAVVAVIQDEALDELTASYLLTALGSTDSAVLALELADWLFETRPNLGRTEAIIDAALRVAATSVFGPDAALSHYRRRRAVGLKPTVYAANMAITACSHSGHAQEALEVLEQMAQDGLEPNEYSLIMALQAANYKRKGMHKEAMRIVAAWSHGPLLPSSVVDLLLDVFEAAILKAPSLEVAHEVFEDLKSIGFHDTTRAYNAILGVCARHGNWNQARGIFEGMVAEDVPADAHTFNALLKACVKGGSLEAALDIYEWLVAGRDVHSPIPADIDTYNILIQACHQAGYLEKALEISNWAMATGLQFNSTTYKELIETIEVAQIWDQKALKGTSSGGFLQGGPRQSSPQSQQTSASHSGSASHSPRLHTDDAAPLSPRALKALLPLPPAPLAILPHHLRPAPHNGLRVLYLDHLEELQDEALLAASKLKSSSWANTLMQGGHSSTGVSLPPLPSSTSVTAAMAGAGIFSSSLNSQQLSPRWSRPPAALSLTPIALSRVPSRLGQHS